MPLLDFGIFMNSEDEPGIIALKIKRIRLCIACTNRLLITRVGTFLFYPVLLFFPIAEIIVCDSSGLEIFCLQVLMPRWKAMGLWSNNCKLHP
ncbi:hypothetical protein CDAR_577441 [Caerostris darwini]|uniref:Uncharacterized protein n=1 Tax=Caerostris darwini TaxID=1538125 RepID=A0AAV4U3P5_9ARAC|nr:hypothetical protein CDAR_577441 [Caerostris darwini]